MPIGHSHLSRAHVTRVPEVGGRADHAAINGAPSPLLENRKNVIQLPIYPQCSLYIHLISSYQSVGISYRTVQMGNFYLSRDKTD